MTLKEKLASLEHDQWMYWATGIRDFFKHAVDSGCECRTCNLMRQKFENWEKFFVPYAQLAEDVKELDNQWAEKAIRIIENHIEHK